MHSCWFAKTDSCWYFVGKVTRKVQYLTLQLIAFRNSVNIGKHRKTTSWLDKEQIREKDRRRNNDVDADRTGFCILSGFLGISPSDSAHFRRLSPFFTSWDPIFPNLRRARFEGFENRLTELQVGTSFLCPHRNWMQLECCLWVTRWCHDGNTTKGHSFHRFHSFHSFQVSQVRHKTSVENLDVAVTSLEPLRATAARLRQHVWGQQFRIVPRCKAEGIIWLIIHDKITMTNITYWFMMIEYDGYDDHMMTVYLSFRSLDIGGSGS